MIPTQNKNKNLTRFANSRKAEPALKAKYLDIQEYDESETNFHELHYMGYEMPGSQDQRHDWCGTWAWRGCLNHAQHPGHKDFVEPYQKRCGTMTCKICYKFSLSRETARATERLERAQKKLKKDGKALKHFILSPPHWLHRLPLDKLRKEAYKIVESVTSVRRMELVRGKPKPVKRKNRNVGGMMLLHAYRKNHDTKMWYFSPHFHAVGFGWIEDTKEEFNQSGWIVKNKGRRDSVSKTVYYLLSHCTIVRGKRKSKHAVTWYGSASYSKLKIEKKEDETKKCPHCHQDLVDLQPLEPYKPPDDMEPGLVSCGLYYHPTASDSRRSNKVN